MTHQFSLFDFETMRPRNRVPISRERIEQARALLARGDVKGCIEQLRAVREKLEAFERRITTKPTQNVATKL